MVKIKVFVSFEKKSMQMKKLLLVSATCVLILQGINANPPAHQQTPTVVENDMNVSSHQYVQKKVLSNGMTILVRPVTTLPKVSMQLWYNVGSKDEKTGERGIAHLIEHMIFKGTKKLTESDINIITHKLSGTTNAFTSYDYTGYLFNMPVQHWRDVFPIFADCMQNVSFKDDHLNSEMKAVIQELKLGRDDYRRTLFMELFADILPEHPYHFPVIGFKQDLWAVKAADLRAFYQKHYWPNNATLVVVGDVKPEEVFALAESTFGKIPSNPLYKKEKFFHNSDIISRSITLYRDIQQPFVFVAYIIPGMQAKLNHTLDVMDLVLGEGKASRLNHKLVDELQLVTSVGTNAVCFFEHGIYIIAFEPKRMEDTQKIIDIIQKEIDSIVEHGLKEVELVRAVKQAQMHYYGLLERIEDQAYQIGLSYLATGDPDYAFKYLNEPSIELEHEIQNLLSEYFRGAVRHQAMVLPLPAREREVWKELQKQSDELDAKILAMRERLTPIESPSYANTVEPREASKFDFPKSTSFVLSNGLKVLYYNSKNTPKINIALRLQAEAYYEPEQKAGVYSFTTNVMTEGTQKYTAMQLAHELENRGMSLAVAPGSVSMSMLSDDLEIGLTLLEEILSRPRFDQAEIEKVRAQLLAQLKHFWDEPSLFANQLINERIYQNHPFSKRTIGTEKTLEKITRADLVECHKKFITPSHAVLAIVGDLEVCSLQNILEMTLGKWKGADIEPIKFPAIRPVVPTEIVYPMNRDQVTLAFAGLSVDRRSPDFDKLQLFDQIFGGGVLGSLHSQLFALREQSGLFYAIAGSLTAGTSEERGLVLVKTRVSLDRLAEAEKVIKETIDRATENITDEEFAQARQAIVNSIINYFATNQSIAQSFLFLDRYGFAKDFFDTRHAQLSKVSKQEMIAAVKKVLSSSRMLELKIGRLEPQKAQVCESVVAEAAVAE